MKKRIVSLLVGALSILMLCQTAFAVKMYAPDGRTENVEQSDVEAWKAVGWYTKNSITMYAPGKSAKVNLTDVEAWNKVGWYEYKVTTMYDSKGTSRIVASSDINSWKAKGWFSNNQQRESL